MYWLLILVHFSFWSGNIDQRLPMGIFKTEEMCEEHGASMDGPQHHHLCVQTDDPVLPERQ
jgi:hypothetical protein